MGPRAFTWSYQIDSHNMYSALNQHGSDGATDASPSARDDRDWYIDFSQLMLPVP
jgi:hypothetical protein